MGQTNREQKLAQAGQGPCLQAILRSWKFEEMKYYVTPFQICNDLWLWIYKMIKLKDYRLN